VALLNRLNSDSSLAPLVAQFVPLKISTEREEWQQWARRYQAEGAAIPKIYIVGADCRWLGLSSSWRSHLAQDARRGGRRCR
jgi:hypothetical protein